MEPLSDEEKFILKASEEVEKASQTTNFPIEKSLFLSKHTLFTFDYILPVHCIFRLVFIKSLQMPQLQQAQCLPRAQLKI